MCFPSGYRSHCPKNPEKQGGNSRTLPSICLNAPFSPLPEGARMVYEAPRNHAKEMPA